MFEVKLTISGRGESDLNLIKFLGKNQNGFRRNRSASSPILTIGRIIQRVRANNVEETQGIWFPNERKDGAKSSDVYGLSKNTNEIVCLTDDDDDDDIDFFDSHSLAGVCQCDILALFFS